MSWLTDHADVLLAELNDANTPVALMLEHEDDPLGEPHAVDGLITVLGAEPPVTILRCDTSILGALAYGASAVAVGDSSTTRHIFPSGASSAGGGYRRPRVSTLVPALLTYFHLDKIDAALTATPELPVWNCECRVCANNRLDWISNSSQPGVYAFEHAVSALASTGRALYAHTGPAGWPTRWADAVRDAVNNHHPISARIGSDRRTWRPSNGLREWLNYYERSGPPTSVPH